MVLFATIGLICVWAGHAITRIPHWIPWVFALLLLEPAGLTCLLASAFTLAPRSRISAWFANSLPRTKLGLLALLSAFLSFVIGALLWCLFELWRLNQ